MCSAAGAGRAELECSVLEEDWQRGQRYMAHWHSFTIVPQHQQRPIVMEAERSEKHGEAKRLLQRILSGAMGPKLQQAHVTCKQRSKELCLRGK
ncbi:hypothetical protein CesoFtcFv8_022132 [Champsocephalus esox]|uniref:Uncharacterized protein n=2 Tax=Champsocephalus TaxID=52236 RepID=A0AAN8CRS3_CHAGU|nr:hypothetical protein CesoFtcFv8_022132 [Champsocephalus esox]KAK5906028.1 hypothetical protein CgunFtcFv8_001930 [Champsocephalus gunnari]